MSLQAEIKPSDRQDIIDVILRYFWLVDHGRADETIPLFSSHATLTFGPGAPKPGTIEGPAISAAMVARARLTSATTRHVVSNIQMHGRGVGEIDCSSLLTLYRSDDDSRDSHPASVADIEDRFILEDGAWKIGQRIISPVFNKVGR
jgi:hypothetical protein